MKLKKGIDDLTHNTGWLKNKIAVPTRKNILKLLSTSHISQMWHTVADGIEGKYRNSVWNQPSANRPTFRSWCSKWSASTGSFCRITFSKTRQHVLRHRSSGQYICCRLYVKKKVSITSNTTSSTTADLLMSLIFARRMQFFSSFDILRHSRLSWLLGVDCCTTRSKIVSCNTLSKCATM